MHCFFFCENTRCQITQCACDFVSIFWVVLFPESFFRKVRVSIKFLSAKFVFTPPPPRKGPKMRKNCTNRYKILKIDTFSGGGGWTAILWAKRFYGHLGVSESFCWSRRKFRSICNASEHGHRDAMQRSWRCALLLRCRPLSCQGNDEKNPNPPGALRRVPGLLGGAY